MQYGPEHDKVIRQVFGNHEPLPVAREVGLHSPRGRDNPDAGKLPLDLEPTDRSGPKRLHDFVCRFLARLGGRTLP